MFFGLFFQDLVCKVTLESKSIDARFFYWFYFTYKFEFAAKSRNSFEIQYFFRRYFFVKSKLRCFFQILLSFSKNSVVIWFLSSENCKNTIISLYFSIFLIRKKRLRLNSSSRWLQPNVFAIDQFGKECKWLSLLNSESKWRSIWRKGKLAWLSTKAVSDLTIDIHKTEH